MTEVTVDFNECINQVTHYHTLMVESMIKSKCTHCKYAKTCNPKRNVYGIEISNERVPSADNLYLSEKFKTRFVCHKFSLRKKPVSWDETRIYKMAYTIKK